jgi:hypothetical protein
MGSLRSNTSSALAPSVTDVTSSASASASFIGSFVSSETTLMVPDIADGRAWSAIEMVRSVCLQGDLLLPSLRCKCRYSRITTTGMSLERLTPTDTSKILSVYLSGTEVLPVIESNISRPFPENPRPPQSSGSGLINNPSFTRYRELWRWVECLLRRTIVAASRACCLNGEQEIVLWTLFSQYQTCSTYWPPTFRATHRSNVAVLFIRALILRSRLTSPTPVSLHTYFRPGNSDIPLTASMVARRAIQDYHDILNASTRFPRAGERNVKVEELTDLCVAVWEAGGSKSGDAAWVLDVRILEKDKACQLTLCRSCGGRPG